MRTTIDLPDELFRELKTTAAQRGTSIKELARTAVEHELSTPQPVSKPHSVQFPLLSPKEPGKLALNSAEIEDLLA